MRVRKPTQFAYLSLIFGCSLASLGVSQTTAPTLDPPLVEIANKIQNTIGMDPLVRIDPLDFNASTSTYGLTIHALFDEDQAEGLATLLIPKYTIGSASLVISVQAPGGSVVKPQDPTAANDVINTVYDALYTNPFFVGSVSLGLFIEGPGVGCIFSRDIAQFVNNNAGDVFESYTATAQEAFFEIIQTKFNTVTLFLGTQPRGALRPLVPSVVMTTRLAALSKALRQRQK